MPLKIERTRGGSGRVFKLVGTLDDVTVRQLERAVSGPAGDGEDLSLDLADLDVDHKSGIELFVRLARRTETAGARLALVAPRAEVRAALQSADLGAVVIMQSGAPGL